MGAEFDVFISYGHADAAWVEVLAANLHRAGFEVFLDVWEIGPGDTLVHRLDEAILHASSGILVVSPAALQRPWVRAEYAAMATRSVQGRQRLIPVLLGDAELPPLLASLVYVDFRNADGPDYDRPLEELIRGLRGQRVARPHRDSPRAPPPGTGFRAQGPLRARLRLAPDRVSFTITRPGDAETTQVHHRPAGLDHRVEERLWQIDRARQQGSGLPVTKLPQGTDAEVAVPVAESLLHRRLLEAGSALTAAFLEGEAGSALAGAVAEAERLGAWLELALEVDGALADLPWETLMLPGPGPVAVRAPLVLHPRVELYRAVPGLGPTPAIPLRGPLRILVAIGSPDRDGGELLDYEAELSRILDAVDPARRLGRAFVRILSRGSLDAVREALAAQRFHVLHVSCHAEPGRLVLEREDGSADLVDAQRFSAEALAADEGVPLVVLSGCATALTERVAATEGEPGAGSGGAGAGHDGDGEGEGEGALPGLARQPSPWACRRCSP